MKSSWKVESGKKEKPIGFRMHEEREFREITIRLGEMKKKEALRV